MSLKQNLEKLRDDVLTTFSLNKGQENTFTETLDTKVDYFIEWYFQNMVKGYYTDSGEYKKPRELRNFIEKIAVWYELRFPKYLVGSLIPCTDLEKKDVSESMFQKNPYVNEQLDEESEVRILDWEKFYNFDSFLDSLPWNEKSFFQKVPYNELVYVNISAIGAHLHLNKDGYVEMAEGISACLNYQISDEQLEGLHLKKIVELLKQNGFPLPTNNELEDAIAQVENWEILKNGILDCAMYRIIERGGNRIGPRRGLLFAKEFHRDINIPMIYGVDTSDPMLRTFANEYLKAGGSKDLVCYEDYFSRTSERPQLTTTSLASILDSTVYTEEETNFHQRLVNVLASRVDPTELKKAQIKQLRIERKLAKSRKNS